MVVIITSTMLLNIRLFPVFANLNNNSVSAF